MRLTSRISKIQTLVELAEIDQEKAAKTYAVLQGQYKQHAEQLESLQTYLNEYRIDGGSERPMQSIQVLSTHAFLDKLRDAIQSESDKVQQLSETVERAREAWLEKRTRLKAMQNLLEKLRSDRSAQLDRQEQRFLDELASQSFNNHQARRNQE